MPQTRASKMWHALVNHGIISNQICKIDRKTIHDFCGVRSFTHTYISSLDIEVCKDDLNAIRFLVRKSASTARQVFGSYLNKYIHYFFVVQISLFRFSVYLWLEYLPENSASFAFGTLYVLQLHRSIANPTRFYIHNMHI